MENYSYNGNGGTSYTPIRCIIGTIPNQFNGYGIYVAIPDYKNGSLTESL
jgi:hypothetical protein